eukprot:5586676-Amphidinium_carterae.1
MEADLQFVIDKLQDHNENSQTTCKTTKRGPFLVTVLKCNNVKMAAGSFIGLGRVKLISQSIFM